MKNCLKISGLILLIFSITCCNRKAANEPARPNLLYIFPDQFRVQAMGFMDEDPVYTPNLDDLALSSRIFVNAVSNRPLCSPYRGMLMTGKYCFSINLLQSP